MQNSDAATEPKSVLAASTCWQSGPRGAFELIRTVRARVARQTSPLSVPPPRSTRFGSPLVLSRVHWVEPKLVAEITYLTWTADGLLRHTVYVGLREDKPAVDVRRETAGGR